MRTFRENLREAFNKAEVGEFVRIERYGKHYILMQGEAQASRQVELVGTPLDLFYKFNAPVFEDPTYTDVEETA